MRRGRRALSSDQDRSGPDSGTVSQERGELHVHGGNVA